MVFWSGIVLEIGMCRRKYPFFSFFRIEWNCHLKYMLCRIIIMYFLSYICVYFRFGTMRWLWIIGSFDNMRLCDTIMRMGYDFFMNRTSSMYNSHISEEKYSKYRNHAYKFRMREKHFGWEKKHHTESIIWMKKERANEEMKKAN